jgi:acetolactate synthase-1/2/3 large subunit
MLFLLAKTLNLSTEPDNRTPLPAKIIGRCDRAGNFAIQNSDLIISLGSRLSVCLTGFEYELFGKNSKLVVIDIDEDELQ